METTSFTDSTGPADDAPTAYAVDRFGSASFAKVLDSLIQDADLDALSAAIGEYGLEAVAEQYLRVLVERGALHAGEDGAYAAAERILAEDRHASPEVHAITVADLADEFTRLDLTDPASSCG
jgi:hypothetical protein